MRSPPGEFVDGDCEGVDVPRADRAASNVRSARPLGAAAGDATASWPKQSFAQIGGSELLAPEAIFRTSGAFATATRPTRKRGGRRDDTSFSRKAAAMGLYPTSPRFALGGGRTPRVLANRWSEGNRVLPKAYPVSDLVA